MAAPNHLQHKRLSGFLNGLTDDGGLTFALQALLSRHESYINESQAEQARMSTCISELEADRLSLQHANEDMVAENKILLQRLEQANGSLADSDLHVKRLENLLMDCELEVKRLDGLVRRTEELNNRIQELEQERQDLHEQMEEDREETRSTLTRWKESERKVRQLEDDLRRIEMESRQDRERHEEIVAKLERERNLERELIGAEGRLKGAAALQSINTNEKGTKQVVTHFVRDILQDNANLQAGITELRELLQSSNEEVQNLREQIMMHQSLDTDEVVHESRRHTSLDQELSSDVPSLTKHQQAVHVHHHYHAKASKGRTTSSRRPARRRANTPGFGSISESSTPSTPTSKLHRFNSSPVVPLNLPQPSKNNRWSMQSTATMSSVLSSMPSSPRSYFDRRGSFFDRLERGEESSRPTSPESIADALPPGPSQWNFRREKRDLDACEEEKAQKETFDMSPLVESKSCFDVNELSTPSETDFGEESLDSSKEITPKPSFILQPEEEGRPDTITSEHPPAPEDQPHIGDQPDPVLSNEQSPGIVKELQPTVIRPSRPVLDIPSIRPSLTRKGSHETLVSISGMDIHIAQRPTPTTTLELLNRHFAHSPTQVRKVSAAQPLASVTEYTAISSPISASQAVTRPSMPNMPSSMDLLSGIAAPRPKPAVRSSSDIGAIGRLGGWVRGKWGVAPTKSSGNLRALAAAQAQAQARVEAPVPIQPLTASPTQMEPLSANSAEATSVVKQVAYRNAETILVPPHKPLNPLHKNVDPAILFAGRSPGINQPGLIPGFRAVVMSKRTPNQVMASVIDEEGLKEGLAE